MASFIITMSYLDICAFSFTGSALLIQISHGKKSKTNSHAIIAHNIPWSAQSPRIWGNGTENETRFINTWTSSSSFLSSSSCTWHNLPSVICRAKSGRSLRSGTLIYSHIIHPSPWPPPHDNSASPANIATLKAVWQRGTHQGIKGLLIPK